MEEVHNRLSAQFGVVPAFAFKEFGRHINDATLVVYVHLCIHANQQRRSWPGFDRLGEDTGKSRSTIIRAIKELQKYRLITVERHSTHGRGRTNSYVINDKASIRAYFEVAKKKL